MPAAMRLATIESHRLVAFACLASMLRQLMLPKLPLRLLWLLWTEAQTAGYLLHFGDLARVWLSVTNIRGQDMIAAVSDDPNLNARMLLRTKNRSAVMTKSAPTTG